MGGESAASPQWAWYTSTILTTNVFVTADSNELQVDGDSTLSTATWYFACYSIPNAASSHGSNSDIFLDGVAEGLTVDTDTWTSGPTYSGNFLIGETNEAASVGHDGDIGWLGIWDGDQLTAAEAAACCDVADAITSPTLNCP